MPRLFTSRRRQFDILSKKPTRKSNATWELANGILYIIGGLTFIIGSIFFLPRYEHLSDIGAWIFFGGSIVYLIVTVQDLFESSTYLSSRHPSTIWNWLELLVATVYVGGTVLFTIGSLLFVSFIDEIVAGGWCFTIGSLLFLVGAFINIVQIVQERSVVKLQLFNVTAITFALGSTLFLIASLPYLSEALNIDNNRVLFRYVGWEYIVGSILFLVGGVLYFYRLYQGKARHTAQQGEKARLDWQDTLDHLNGEKQSKEKTKTVKIETEFEPNGTHDRQYEKTTYVIKKYN